MPQSLQMIIKGDPEKKHPASIASAFQGALMEQIDSGYASRLHENQLHPYSQHIERDGEQLIWTLSALDEEARIHIILINPSSINFR